VLPTSGKNFRPDQPKNSAADDKNSAPKKIYSYSKKNWHFQRFTKKNSRRKNIVYQLDVTISAKTITVLVQNRITTKFGPFSVLFFINMLKIWPQIFPALHNFCRLILWFAARISASWQHCRTDALWNIVYTLHRTARDSTAL
jgi:hypothetical protein